MNNPGSDRQTRRCAAVFCAAVFALFGGSIWASAQGNGHGHAYGHYKKQGGGAGPSAAGAPELQVPGTGLRTFGSWLDDASVMPRGEASVSVAFGYWRTPAYREFDFPVMDGGFGLTRKVQVGFSVPYYHASEPSGPVARGLGDLYITTKVQLRDPSTAQRRLGVSITPIFEVLSYAPRPGASRVSWALPASLELQSGKWRLFGSTGYFSRGALFASGAIERQVSNRIWTTGTISRSHSMERDDLSAAMGLTQSRTDVSGGLNVALTPAVTAFGSFGRTISRRDANSSTLSVSSGVSFAFARQRR